MKKTIQLFVLLPVAIIAVLTSCSKKSMSTTPSPTPVPTSPAAKTYLALGDSYTIGQSVSEADRYPHHTVLLLRAQNITIDEPRIIATTGWTTRNLLDALNSANLPTNYDVVSLLIGVNNQYQGKSIEEYKTEFTQLVNRAIQYANNRASHVFVLSIPDYSGTPFAQNMDKVKITAEIDQFNAANKTISLQLGVNYLNITPISRETDPELLAGDGLHPSGKQYKRWADLLAPMMKAVLQ